METSEKTDSEKEDLLNRYIKYEVSNAAHKSKELPSLFSNFIKPWIKDLATATEYYGTLNDEQMQRRAQINIWEFEAWEIYEFLNECSIYPMCKSIDPKLWAQKEIINVGLLLDEGKNHLMTVCEEYCLERIPTLFHQLISGKWLNFISLDELESFNKTRSNYFKEHGIDECNPESYKKCNTKIFMLQPRKKELLNQDYIAAQQIQALLWYKEFLTDIVHHGLTFEEDHEENDQEDDSLRKNFGVNSPKRTNDGFEAIKVSFNDFFTEKDRIPKWSELMSYMVEYPPQGILIKGGYVKNKLIAIIIEGIDKPIDRDAFRNRFNRYFKKTDVKPDNS